LRELEPILADVARSVGLAEGMRGVDAVLRAIARQEPVSVRALGRAADLPVPIVAAVCGELRQRGVVAEERPVQLTIAWRRRLAADSAPSLETVCETCGGRGIVLPPAIGRMRRGLAHVADAAPPPRVELDQCHCTPKAKLRRVLALHAAEAIRGRRILLLGDDDLISIALARFAALFEVAGAAEELVVVDVDERLLAFIGDELEVASFPVRLVHHDLRDPLPPDLAGRFHTVVTDPPYTAAGGRMFLAHAIAALAGIGSAVFLSFGSRRPGVQLALQQAIVEAGLEIRSLTRDFNDYVGAGVLGGTSHLYHLALAPTSVGETGLYTYGSGNASAA
jgi:N4-bis(aminopropyl)spermidine synthase